MLPIESSKNLDKTVNDFINIINSQECDNSQENEFIVQNGDFYRTDPFKLCDEYRLPSCYGNNSNSPYFSCAMASGPNQTVRNFVNVKDDKYLAFRLGFNEAVVIIGNTPPKVDYFSYCIFLTTRFLDDKNDVPEGFEITPLRNKPTKFERKVIERYAVFGSLGEPLNNLKINTPGTPNGTSGCPFNQPFMIVVTANEDLQKRIHDFACEAGLSPDSLNTLVISKDVANLGVDSDTTDTFTIINRIASQDKDDPKLQEYLLNPGVHVLRVTQNSKKGKAFPVPLLTPRGTGTTELQYSKLVDELRNRIIEHYSDEYDSVDIPTDIWLQESSMAIQQKLNDLGESRDTVYLGSGSFKLPLDAFIVVYGVNHAKTGKCTYCNAVVYGNKYDNGVVSVSNKDLEESALLYLDRLEAEYLYAWRFGFNEDPGFYGDPSENYTQIRVYTPDENKEGIEKRHTLTIDPNEDIFLGFRAYMEQATKVGPSWNELILDRAIVFLKKKK